MTEGFVYCWTDLKTDMLYVGVHKGSLNDGYVCSSKWMLEEYSERPKDFSRQIIAEGLYEDMRALEESILKSLNAKKDKRFYNMHNGNGNFFLKAHTRESRKKISEGNKGRKRSDLSERNKQGHSAETRAKISKNHHDVSGENNPMFGKNRSSEERKKMSATRKKKWMSGEYKDSYAKLFGKKEIVECPFCKKQGGSNAMKRWHFENCKEKQ